MISPIGELKWNVESLADSLGIMQSDVNAYFKDGRKVSFILERRICKDIIGGSISGVENTPFDIICGVGDRWEVRSISAHGMYFCPSYMVGSGRKFDEEGFLQKLVDIDGYLIGDITKFPNIPVWKIDKHTIYDWYVGGTLGKITKVSHDKFMELVS